MRLLIAIILILLVISITKWIEKFLGVKKEFVSDTPGKRINRWGRIIIAGIFLSLYFYALISKSDTMLKWSSILLLTSLMGLQSLLEWKYVKESKQYIITLISSTVVIGIWMYYLLRIH